MGDDYCGHQQDRGVALMVVAYIQTSSSCNGKSSVMYFVIQVHASGKTSVEIFLSITENVILLKLPNCTSIKLKSAAAGKSRIAFIML